MIPDKRTTHASDAFFIHHPKTRHINRYFKATFLRLDDKKDSRLEVNSVNSR